MSWVGGPALRGASNNNNNNNSSGRPLERWEYSTRGLGPNWFDALHENEAAVAVPWFSGPCPSKVARTWLRFGGVPTLAAVWPLARLRWSLPEQALLRSHDRAVGKGLCSSMLSPVLSWVLSSPLSHQRALPPAEVARWTPVRETSGPSPHNGLYP